MTPDKSPYRKEIARIDDEMLEKMRAEKKPGVPIDRQKLKQIMEEARAATQAAFRKFCPDVS